MMNNDSQDTEDLEALAQEAAEWEQASGETLDAASPEELQRLRDELARKTKEADETQEKYLRTYADFENYRKRMQRDLAEFRKYANEQLVYELLAVVDSMGLALRHAAEAGETNQGLRDGVELVYKQFRDALEKFGVKQFQAEGEPFDPAKHDAMMQVETTDAPENTVVRVLQEGYLYHDKVLRHAKVGVAKKPAVEAEKKTG